MHGRFLIGVTIAVIVAALVTNHALLVRLGYILVAVLAVAGAEGRAATCLRVVFEELHFSKDARIAFKGEVTVPLRVESRLAMPAPKKALERATSQAALED